MNEPEKPEISVPIRGESVSDSRKQIEALVRGTTLLTGEWAMLATNRDIMIHELVHTCLALLDRVERLEGATKPPATHLGCPACASHLLADSTSLGCPACKLETVSLPRGEETAAERQSGMMADLKQQAAGRLQQKQWNRCPSCNGELAIVPHRNAGSPTIIGVTSSCTKCGIQSTCTGSKTFEQFADECHGGLRELVIYDQAMGIGPRPSLLTAEDLAISTSPESIRQSEEWLRNHGGPRPIAAKPLTDKDRAVIRDCMESLANGGKTEPFVSQPAGLSFAPLDSGFSFIPISYSEADADAPSAAPGSEIEWVVRDGTADLATYDQVLGIGPRPSLRTAGPVEFRDKTPMVQAANSGDCGRNAESDRANPASIMSIPPAYFTMATSMANLESAELAKTPMVSDRHSERVRESAARMAEMHRDTLSKLADAPPAAEPKQETWRDRKPLL